MGERIKYPLVITLICLVSAAGLALTFAATRDRIAASREQDLVQGLQKVLPEHESLAVEEMPGDKAVYVAYSGPDETGDRVGYAAVGEAQGYASTIRVLVGVRPDLEIEAITVLEMAETPGLGEQARERPPTKSIWQAIGDLFRDAEPEERPEPPFQEQFRGKRPNQLRLTDEPDSDDAISQLTGATITSRAIVDATRRAIDLIREYRERE